jgi:hypothetical protein
MSREYCFYSCSEKSPVRPALPLFARYDGVVCGGIRSPTGRYNHLTDSPQKSDRHCTASGTLSGVRSCGEYNEWLIRHTNMMLRTGKRGGTIRCRSCSAKTEVVVMQCFRWRDHSNFGSEGYQEVNLGWSSRGNFPSHTSCCGWRCSGCRKLKWVIT